MDSSISDHHYKRGNTLMMVIAARRKSATCNIVTPWVLSVTIALPSSWIVVVTGRDVGGIELSRAIWFTDQCAIRSLGQPRFDGDSVTLRMSIGCSCVGGRTETTRTSGDGDGDGDGRLWAHSQMVMGRDGTRAFDSRRNASHGVHNKSRVASAWDT